MRIASNRSDQWRIAFAALLFFAPWLGGVHLFDWDEINFAEIAREMVVSHQYLSPQLDFQPFTEKPPFFFWLQALSMNLFGVGEYAARFPNVLAGLFSLLLIYDIGFRLHGQRLARWWSLAYFGSTLPHLYFKSGLIDPWFNLFIFSGIWFLIKYHWRTNALRGSYLKQSPAVYLLMAAVFTGLGILTKGPVAYLITGLVLAVYWVMQRFKFFIKPFPFLLYTLVMLLVTGLWYGLETMFNGPEFVVEFTLRQWALLTTPDAGHGGFPGYHFVVLLFGCFPASAFALHALFTRHDDGGVQRDMRIWMTILLCVVLVLFTLVKSKIIHYSSLAYFPLTYLAAYSLERLSNGRWDIGMGYRLLLGLIGGVYVLAGAALVWLGQHPEQLQALAANDAFAQANFEAAVQWPWHTWLPSLLALFLLMGFQWFYGKNRIRSLNYLFMGQAIWVQLALVSFIARVEGFSQRAHIEFFESVSDHEAYLTTYKFKSYVPYFYGDVQPRNAGSSSVWNAEIPLKRRAYISVKEGKQEEFEQVYPRAVKLYQKNGFHFYKLLPEAISAQP